MKYIAIILGNNTNKEQYETLQYFSNKKDAIKYRKSINNAFELEYSSKDEYLNNTNSLSVEIFKSDNVVINDKESKIEIL